MKILIVEDDKQVAKQLKDVFKEVFENAKVVLCHQISTATAEITSHVYDLISLDIHLPDGNGLELAKDIRQSKLNSSTYLLMISGDAHLETAYNAYDQTRCFKFLNKPYNKTQLIEILYLLKKSISTQEVNRYFTHQNRQMMIKIPTLEIIYFEIFYKTCHIHTTNETITITRYPLKAILESVSEHEFIQVHRSFVISKQHLSKVEMIDKQWYCIINDKTKSIPVGKKYLEGLKTYMSL